MTLPSSDVDWLVVSAPEGWLLEGAPADVRRPAPGLWVVQRGGTLVEQADGWGGLGWHRSAAAPAEQDEPGRLGALIDGARRGRLQPLDCYDGSFAAILWERPTRRVIAVTDAFRSRTLYYSARGEVFACATRLSLLVDHGLAGSPPALDAHAIFHYLNFSYVPTPFTPFRAVRKAPPGAAVYASAGSVRVERHFRPSYPEDLAGGTDDLARRLREQIEEAVLRHRPSGRAWGSFLSGGTDSSSIAGILARAGGEAPVRTFSIGFEEAGFDELGYVEIAARAFGLSSESRRSSADEALGAMTRLAEWFDEPFGNSSAIATHACASHARAAGAEVLLGGDGGDEIFGGNERYRKDRILEAYYGSPRLVRGAGALAARALAGVDHRWANRIKNFVRRGALPIPDRFYTDDSFASDHFETLLTPEFRSGLAPEESLDVMRAVYRESDAPTEIHRLMYLDLCLTISDNDLVKVTGACRAAGVEPAFPFLDPRLVQFTGRLPGWTKIKGLEKRYLFKRAMRGLLPDEILAKKKHGFGVPVSVWLREHRGFQELVNDTLMSRAGRQRGYFQPDFVAQLLERHRRGVWDHGQEIYMLVALELWHRACVDRPRPGSAVPVASGGVA